MENKSPLERRTDGSAQVGLFVPGKVPPGHRARHRHRLARKYELTDPNERDAMVHPHDHKQLALLHRHASCAQNVVVVFAKRVDHHGSDRPVDQEQNQPKKGDEGKGKQHGHVCQSFLRLHDQPDYKADLFAHCEYEQEKDAGEDGGDGSIYCV